LSSLSGDGKIKGSISGIAMPSAAQKVWRVSQAIGDIAFAYPYSIILLEIEVFISPWSSISHDIDKKKFIQLSTCEVNLM
jgi:hypothetical protein